MQFQMPNVDTSIPLRGDPIHVPTPHEIEAERLTLANLRDARSMNAMQLTKAQRSMDEEDQLRAIFRNTPDPEKALSKVYGVNPHMGISMSKSIFEQKKASIDLMTSTIDNRLKQADELARIFGSIKDDATLHMGVQAAVERGYLKPEAAQQLGNVSFADPQVQAFLQQKTMEAMSVKDQLAEQRARADEQRKALEQQWKVEDRPDQKAKLGADAAKAKEDAAGLQMGNAARSVPDNQADYDAWRAQLAPAVQARVPAMFSPSAVQFVQRMGMTAAEQAADSDRDASRTQAVQFHRDTVDQQGRMFGLAAGNSAETRRYHDLSIGAAAGKTGAEFKKKSLEMGNLESALTEYEKKLDTVGPTMRTGSPDGAVLKTQFTNLQMQIKNLYELGAITGPDMALLGGAITDPTGLQGTWAGKETLKAQLSTIKSIVARSKVNLAAAYQQQTAADAQSAGGAAALQSMSNDQLLRMLINAGSTPSQ